MPQPIQLNRTTNPASVPSLLFEGEPAVAVAPALTRLWIGDGAANRLLLSSNPADPLGAPIATANYLALSGGTMAGQIITLPPVALGDAVNKNYVDTSIAALRNFIGTWQVAANTPNITGGAPTPGDYYIAVTANPTVPETVPVGIPGIAGQVVNNGDVVIWDAVGSIWELIRGGPLTVAEADAMYLQLVGGTMTGPLLLAGAPTVDGEAANKNYVDGLVGQYLPLTGGMLTGTITATNYIGAAGIALVVRGGAAATDTSNGPGFTISGSPAGSTSGNAGTLTIQSVAPGNPTGNGGSVLIRSAAIVGTGGNSGDVTLSSGSIAAGAGSSGSVIISSGSSGTGPASGNVTLAVGTATLGVRGSIYLQAPNVILLNDPTSALGAATKQYVDAAIAGAITTVVTDGVSITGDGTAGAPLTVALIDGGTF
jgi:hypothetical protein